jgi:hypothetical protein
MMFYDSLNHVVADANKQFNSLGGNTVKVA